MPQGPNNGGGQVHPKVKKKSLFRKKIRKAKGMLASDQKVEGQDATLKAAD